MAKRISAGILLYRLPASGLEVLLVVPGGPYWAKKDAGAWTIPKGEVEGPDDFLQTAVREFCEETGTQLPGPFIELQSITQKGGKTVYAFAQEGDLDAAAIKSNNFALEWPPRSGQVKHFPEIREAAWFSIADAVSKINAAQVAFLEQLQQLVLPK